MAEQDGDAPALGVRTLGVSRGDPVEGEDVPIRGRDPVLLDRVSERPDYVRLQMRRSSNIMSASVGSSILSASAPTAAEARGFVANHPEGC